MGRITKILMHERKYANACQDKNFLRRKFTPLKYVYFVES